MSKSVKNIVTNIISLLILIGVDEYIINYLFADQKYYILIALALLEMIIIWFKCNINKKSILFYIGLIYITIPMLYWYFDKKDIETLLWFFWLVCVYNVFSFILFKLISGLQIKINREKLKIVVNIISAVLISLYKLNLSFPENGCITIIKGYNIITTIFFTLILITSDLFLMKIKPLLENESMKELQATESIFPTSGIWIKMANSFLFISYIYIIYVIILKLLYKLIV